MALLKIVCEDAKGHKEFFGRGDECGEDSTCSTQSTERRSPGHSRSSDFSQCVEKIFKLDSGVNETRERANTVELNKGEKEEKREGGEESESSDVQTVRRERKLCRRPQRKKASVNLKLCCKEAVEVQCIN
eukprot:TRINITY_DN3224_c0_g5_i1.p1 TRINITY_DN3224_c0_g5~~TRINITY_DN3224_c0_g5_i1.p1  ORF type:complete len:131 (+),score=33.66 TRINITY_DN3224_c0_g5_i1:260-652(+)